MAQPGVRRSPVLVARAPHRHPCRRASPLCYVCACELDRALIILGSRITKLLYK